MPIEIPPKPRRDDVDEEAYSEGVYAHSNAVKALVRLFCDLLLQQVESHDLDKLGANAGEHRNQRHHALEEGSNPINDLSLIDLVEIAADCVATTVGRPGRPLYYLPEQDASWWADCMYRTMNLLSQQTTHPVHWTVLDVPKITTR